MRTFFSLLFLPALAWPARAQKRPQPGPPEWLVEFVNDVRLGVRVEGGFFRSHLSVAPIEARGLRYLGRPVSSDLSPATTPLYGVSAGLRVGNRAALFGAYRLNDGAGPEAALQFQSGGRAVPSTYDLRQWDLRAHYFVFGQVGVGAIYREERTLLEGALSFAIAGEEITNRIFSGSSERQSFSLYVPARLQLGERTTLFGRLGASVYGRSDEFYNTRFTFYQDPEHPREIHPHPPDPEKSSIDEESAGLNRQFARLGVEHPFFGLAWRLFLAGERVSIGDVSEEWRGGARLQVGLPF